jgi:hypothetical protein
MAEKHDYEAEIDGVKKDLLSNAYIFGFVSGNLCCS